MKILFAITHIDKHNMRTLTLANQGRNHFNTKRQATHALKGLIDNTSESTLISVFGKQAISTFQVRPVECYDHGDAIGIYFTT